jgi:hypothetical protein
MTKPENADEGFDSSVCCPIFELGMSFFFVPNERRHTSDRHVTVSKIGRRWVTLSDGNRFDRTSDNWRIVDGGGYSSPGRLWDSEQQFKDSQKVREILNAIEQRFRFGREYCNVTLEDAVQAARLLGVEVG